MEFFYFLRRSIVKYFKITFFIIMFSFLQSCDDGSSGSSDSGSGSCIAVAGGAIDGEDAEDNYLTAINAKRQNVQTCGTTGFTAQDALKWHDTLYSAAYSHSDDMITNNFTSHNSCDGSTVVDRVTRAGGGFSLVGENITTTNLMGHTIEAAMNLWMGSEAHCKNIMDSRYTSVGVAMVKGKWTMVLGTRTK
jgi:uncharacterized protein YkwD